MKRKAEVGKNFLSGRKKIPTWGVINMEGWSYFLVLLPISGEKMISHKIKTLLPFPRFSPSP